MLCTNEYFTGESCKMRDFFKTKLHIGIWEGPRKFAVETDEDMEYRMNEIKEAGIDTVFLFAELADSDWLERTMRLAVKCGLNLIADTSAVWKDDGKMSETVRKTKDCPAVIAYNIMDEPPYTLFDRLAETARTLKSEVPDKAVFVNLNPNYAPEPYLPEGNTRREKYRLYLEEFLQKVPVDLLSMDFYPYTGSNEAEMKLAMLENLSDAAEAAGKYGIPFAGFLQTARWGRFDDNNDRSSPWHGTRLPNETELRFLANRHLVFGARMLTDFLYWSRSGTRPDQRVPGVFDGIMWENGERSPMYDSVRKINVEIRRSSDILQHCILKGIMTAGLTTEENNAIGSLLLVKFADISNIVSDGRVIAGCFEVPEGKKLMYVMNDSDIDTELPVGVTLERSGGSKETLILPPGEAAIVHYGV